MIKTPPNLAFGMKGNRDESEVREGKFGKSDNFFGQNFGERERKSLDEIIFEAEKRLAQDRISVVGSYNQPIKVGFASFIFANIAHSASESFYALADRAKIDFVNGNSVETIFTQVTA